jgi:hypothetical protein
MGINATSVLDKKKSLYYGFYRCYRSAPSQLSYQGGRAMTSEEIDGLVLFIQSDLAEKMKMPIEQVRQMLKKHQFSPEQLEQLIIKVNENPAYTKLITAVESIAKNRIYSFHLLKLEVDDIWQSFQEKKLKRCVIDFDRRCRFTTLLNRYITNFCIDEIRKITICTPGGTRIRRGVRINEEGEEGGQVANGTISESSLPNPHLTPEQIVLRKLPMDVLKIIIDFLDGLEYNVNNKLVYHCKEILPIIVDNNDYNNYDYLKRWKGKSLEAVSNLIEGMYSKIYETKTVFMKNTIEEQLTRGTEGGAGNGAEDIFLDEVDLNETSGKVYINGRVHEINQSFRKHKAYIIDNINN